MSKAQINLPFNMMRITSGNSPTNLNLPEAYLAFGRVNGMYDIFGNHNGEDVVNYTEFIVESEEDTIKGMIGIAGIAGPTQDITLDVAQELLEIPHHLLEGNTLTVTSRKYIPDELDDDNDDFEYEVPPEDEGEEPDIPPPPV